MDPPTSPHSHPDSAPDPLTPSGENNPPEPPPPQVTAAAASPTGKRKNTTGEEPEKEEIRDDDSTPTKRPHAAESSSKGKEKMEDMERKEEIQILKDILDYYNQNDHTFPFAHSENLTDFYETRFKDRRHKYPTRRELDRKMGHLQTRFLNTFHNIQVEMDPLEGEIYELSKKIWKPNSKDSTEQETEDSKDLKDSSEQETGDDHDSAAMNTGGSPRKRKEEIINLLNDILDFYNKKGRYPYDFKDVDEFYKNWVETRTRVYRNEGDVKRKIKELHVKFVKNLERTYEGEDIKSLMDPIDVKIYELSYRVWGKEDDIGFNHGGNDDSKDEKISKDSSKQETGDDDHETEDSKDSKSSTEQETDDGNDSKDSEDSSSNDSDDSSLNDTTDSESSSSIFGFNDSEDSSSTNSEDSSSLNDLKDSEDSSSKDSSTEQETNDEND